MMEVGGRGDVKIIDVCPDDPVYGSYSSLGELPPHLSEEIAHFFSVYKGLEPGKWTEVGPTLGKEAAIEVIRKAIERYGKAFPEPQE